MGKSQEANTPGMGHIIMKSGTGPESHSRRRKYPTPRCAARLYIGQGRSAWSQHLLSRWVKESTSKTDNLVYNQSQFKCHIKWMVDLEPPPWLTSLLQHNQLLLLISRSRSLECSVQLLAGGCDPASPVDDGCQPGSRVPQTSRAQPDLIILGQLGRRRTGGADASETTVERLPLAASSAVLRY